MNLPFTDVYLVIFSQPSNGTSSCNQRSYYCYRTHRLDPLLGCMIESETTWGGESSSIPRHLETPETILFNLTTKIVLNEFLDRALILNYLCRTLSPTYFSMQILLLSFTALYSSHDRCCVKQRSLLLLEPQYAVEHNSNTSICSTESYYPFLLQYRMRVTFLSSTPPSLWYSSVTITPMQFTT